MRIASAREYSDRSIFMERIKLLDDYDIRNIHSCFRTHCFNNGSIYSWTEKKSFKAVDFKSEFSNSDSSTVHCSS